MPVQPAVLLPAPAFGHYRTWDLTGVAAELVAALASVDLDDALVIGLGASLVAALGGLIDGLEDFAPIHHGDVSVPSTPHALWAWSRSPSAKHAVARLDTLEAVLAPHVRRADDLAAFKHLDGRDLTGFVDGTENPKDDAAIAAAVVADGPLAGSTFVATQRWAHDLDRFHAHPRPEQEAMIGRTLEDDVELADSPASSHVHRTAQESYEPTTFMVRRSMPYRLTTSAGVEQGLNFVAFVHALDSFTRQMNRMAGLDDGIVDALFRFSKPMTSAAFWCPPALGGRLDLRALAIAR